MPITVYIEPRQTYGVWRLYPVNDHAKALANIAGTKTLEPKTIRLAMEGLGASLKVSNQNLTGVVNAMVFNKGVRDAQSDFAR
jgi:hypothetical protein